MSTAEENTPHGNQTAKAFTLTSAFWFAVATTFGLLAATYLIAPDFMANIEFIHFGRLRPMHVNTVLFGFVTPGLIAAAFYYFPRLLKTRLYSEKLGVFSAVFWNITVAAGLVGISLGHSQAREYAEFPWTVDIMVVVSFALVLLKLHDDGPAAPGADSLRLRLVCGRGHGSDRLHLLHRQCDLEA